MIILTTKDEKPSPTAVITVEKAEGDVNVYVNRVLIAYFRPLGDKALLELMCLTGSEATSLIHTDTDGWVSVSR